MTNLALILSLAVSALVLAGTSALAGGKTDDALCTLASTLNDLIADRTSHTPPSGCPEIGFAALPEGGLRSQAGAYDPATGRIELAPDLDLTTAYGQSYLLHELTHAAQYASGAHLTAPCPARLEAEAYMLQADFLREEGAGREALMLRILADQLGTCAEG